MHAYEPARHSKTIAEFCASHGISRGTYYRLKREGRGPEELRLGPQLPRITAAAEEAWLRARAAEARRKVK
jgi:predicted DNA-binding transcriptional regulator AlpA